VRSAGKLLDEHIKEASGWSSGAKKEKLVADLAGFGGIWRDLTGWTN
jgi:hypothetical protein